MRARFLVIYAAFLVVSGSEAFALWVGIPEFRDVVQEAETCILGRVTLSRELREDLGEDYPFKCAAEFEVERVVFGPCRERLIRVYYHAFGIDQRSYAPRERYVLFLQELPPPLTGYESPMIHWGSFHLPRSGPMRVPDKLGNPPKSRNFRDFLDEIRYVRGPEITVRPTKPSFRWDEPVTLEAKFTNPSFREMKLCFAPPPLTEYSFTDQYVSIQGLPFFRPGRLREKDDPEPVEVVLPGHGSTTRSVTFRPHFKEDARFKLGSISHVILEYCTGAVREAEGAWQGSATSAPAPIRISCDDDFERTLADVGARYTLTLDVREKSVPQGKPAVVAISVYHGSRPLNEDRLVRLAFGYPDGQQLRVPEDSLAQLAGQMVLTRDGRHIDVKKAPPRRGSWLGEAVERASRRRRSGWRSFCVELDLAQHYDLSRPGRYTVRLIAPAGGDRPLESNLVEFDVITPSRD